MGDYSTSQSVRIITPMPLHSTTALYHCTLAVHSTTLTFIFTFTFTLPSLNSHNLGIKIIILNIVTSGWKCAVVISIYIHLKGEKNGWRTHRKSNCLVIIYKYKLKKLVTQKHIYICCDVLGWGIVILLRPEMIQTDRHTHRNTHEHRKLLTQPTWLLRFTVTRCGNKKKEEINLLIGFCWSNWSTFTSTI